MSKYEDLLLEEMKLELNERKTEDKQEEIIPTREEIQKRKEIHKKALEIGINLRMTDDLGRDNYYRDLALLYIIKGEDVPLDLKLKIEEEDKRIEENRKNQ